MRLFPFVGYNQRGLWLAGKFHRNIYVETDAKNHSRKDRRTKSIYKCKVISPIGECADKLESPTIISI